MAPVRVPYHGFEYAPPSVDDTVDLVDAFFGDAATTPMVHNKWWQLDIIVKLVCEIGFKPRMTYSQARDSGGQGEPQLVELAANPRWIVRSFPPEDLDTLPDKRGHSGEFEWIGQEDTRRPKWLWDTREARTVPVSEACIDEGYIVISYTWGRWRAGTRKEEGTSWSLPEIRADVCGDMMQSLKQIMATIPASRYFWVDVLCINQDDAAEKEEEIAKQAAIFGGAKACFVYLWTLEGSDELAHVAASLGDKVMWALQFADLEKQVKSELTGISRLPEQIQKKLDAKLRLDPWFTSLWALQEMILSPNAVWLTKSGHFCRVNDKFLTTRLWAQATQLLKWADGYRSQLWEEVKAGMKANIDHVSEAQPQPNTWHPAVNPREQSPTWKTPEEKLEEWKASVGRDKVEAVENSVRHISPNRVQMLTQRRWRTLAPIQYAQRDYDELIFPRSHRPWIDWAFGEVCLNLSISSTRKAIMAAGGNRQTTRRRGEAVMAALKIGKMAVPSNSSARLTPGGYPRWLQQCLLDVSRSDYLYVSHDWRLPADVRAKESPLYTEPSIFVPVDDGVVLQPNLVQTSGYYLTSMLPSTAGSAVLEDFDSQEPYKGFELRGVHLHSDGSVHIPANHRQQIMSGTRARPCLVTISQTCIPQEFVCISPLAEHAVRTLTQVRALVGHSSHVMFLPLMCRELVNMTEKEYLDMFKNNIALVKGVILVSKGSNKRHHSMTYWYKVGNYSATDLAIQSLCWKDGIIVGSKDCEASNRHKADECGPSDKGSVPHRRHITSVLYDGLQDLVVRSMFNHLSAYLKLRFWAKVKHMDPAVLWGRKSVGPIMRDDAFSSIITA
jgi:hypothetical protein